MLETLPYADLLAIYNALAEKVVARFDTRANGVRRTAVLIGERGLTLSEAAQLAEVVLPDGDAIQQSPPTSEAAEMPDESSLPRDGGDNTNNELTSDPLDQEAAAQLDPGIASMVNKFMCELKKPDRPPYLARFLRRLSGERVAPDRREMAGRQLTASQRKIVELCGRPEGATGKELADGCGWPSIAARATCQKLADRFGYVLHESPKANGRGISFRLTAKRAVES
jgi:hypothetical protein